MKKLLCSLLIFGITIHAESQVGIGTNSPDSSAMLEVQSTSRGLLTPRMTVIQRDAITTPQTGLLIYQTDGLSGFYLFDGTNWSRLSQESFGDIKSGVQSADHSGWVLLDGRSITSLTPEQQSTASALGFSGTLPDATDAYLVQNGGAMASVSGSNTTTLTQANLPNVNFTGTTDNSGTHNHQVDPPSVNTSFSGSHSHSGTTSTAGNHSHAGNAVTRGGNGGTGRTLAVGDSNSYGTYTPSVQSAGNHNHSFSTNSNGNHNHSVNIPSTTSTNDGDHSHTVDVSSGGSGTPINVSPRSLTVNMFIYLGL